MDVKTVLAAIEAATAVAEVATALVEKAAGVLSSHDQTQVHIALNKLAGQNEILSANVRAALARAAIQD